MMNASLNNARFHPLAQGAVVRLARTPRWLLIVFALPIFLLLLALVIIAAALVVLFLIITAPARIIRRFSQPRPASRPNPLHARRENVRIAVTSARVIDP